MKKLVPLDVSISGKDVKLLHPYQARSKSVTLDVSINGKDVRLEQPCQVYLKLVAPDISIKGKLVSLLQFSQAFGRSIALIVPSNASRLLHPLKPLFANNIMLDGAGPIAINLSLCVLFALIRGRK